MRARYVWAGRLAHNVQADAKCSNLAYATSGELEPGRSRDAAAEQLRPPGRGRFPGSHIFGGDMTLKYPLPLSDLDSLCRARCASGRRLGVVREHALDRDAVVGIQSDARGGRRRSRFARSLLRVSQYSSRMWSSIATRGRCRPSKGVELIGRDLPATTLTNSGRGIPLGKLKRAAASRCRDGEVLYL